MNSKPTSIRDAKIRYPARKNAVLMKLDFEDHDRVWSLWIETGLRVHCMRLSYSPGYDEGWPSTAVARMNIDDSVLDLLRSAGEDPKALSEQYLDMLLTLATERPPADCISYLRWRMCEFIRRLQLREEINRLQAG